MVRASDEAEELLIEVGTWGLCRLIGVPTSVFYPGPSESQAPAKRICQQCDMRAKCLEYALLAGELHGIWGGLNPRERNRYRKRLAHTVQAP